MQPHHATTNKEKNDCSCTHERERDTKFIMGLLSLNSLDILNLYLIALLIAKERYPHKEIWGFVIVLFNFQKRDKNPSNLSFLLDTLLDSR